MSGGSAYLLNGFDNTTNWQIEADIRLENYSGMWITPTTETARDKNQIVIIATRIYAYVNGTYTLSPNYNNIVNTWKHIKIVKNGSTISLTVDNQTVSVNWSIAQTAPKLSVGVDSWGDTSSIKNVKIKPL